MGSGPRRFDGAERVVLFDYEPRIRRGLPEAQSGVPVSLAAPVAAPTSPRAAQCAFVFRSRTHRGVIGPPGNFCSGSYRQLADDGVSDYRYVYIKVDSVKIYTRVCAPAEFLTASSALRAARILGIIELVPVLHEHRLGAAGGWLHHVRSARSSESPVHLSSFRAKLGSFELSIASFSLFCTILEMTTRAVATPKRMFYQRH